MPMLGRSSSVLGRFRDQFGQVLVEQVADVPDSPVRGRVGSDDFRVEGELALSDEHGGQAMAPRCLHRGQDAHLVVHQDVVLGRVAPLDVCQSEFLVDVNEHLPLDRFKDAGAFDLARLEDHIAIGEDDRRAPVAEALQDVKRTGIEPVGEG